MNTAIIIESILTISGKNICCIDYEHGELKEASKLISSEGFEWEILKHELFALKKKTFPHGYLPNWKMALPVFTTYLQLAMKLSHRMEQFLM